MRDHRADAELAAGADDPQRDLAAVRDEDFMEDGRSPTQQPAPLRLDLCHCRCALRVTGAN
ncbi:MAG: hypothetical protein AAB387_02735, partial [candidate division NC10 bacterium]